MLNAINLLPSSRNHNICLFYSVITCIDFNNKNKDGVSLKLRSDIVEFIKHNYDNDDKIINDLDLEEIHSLESNNMAGERSIYYLSKYFKLNIFVVVYIDNAFAYITFFSSSGNGKYDNNNDFIILYNSNNVHFQPVQLIGNLIFSKEQLLNIYNITNIISNVVTNNIENVMVNNTIVNNIVGVIAGVDSDDDSSIDASYAVSLDDDLSDDDMSSDISVRVISDDKSSKETDIIYDKLFNKYITYITELLQQFNKINTQELDVHREHLDRHKELVDSGCAYKILNNLDYSECKGTVEYCNNYDKLKELQRNTMNKFMELMFSISYASTTLALKDPSQTNESIFESNLLRAIPPNYILNVTVNKVLTQKIYKMLFNIL